MCPAATALMRQASETRSLCRGAILTTTPGIVKTLRVTSKIGGSQVKRPPNG
jgi:hypothetical protein